MESRGVASISALASITVIPLCGPGKVPGDVCRAVVDPNFWKVQTGGTRGTADIKLSELLIVGPPPV